MTSRLNGLIKNRLARNIFGNYILKAISMALSYVLTPVYMNYFSSNKVLGMWFTLIAIINWLIMLDFGIGASARNSLIVAYEKKDNSEISKILSSGLFVNTVIILVLCVIQHILFENIDCYRFVGVTANEISYKQLTLVIHILSVGVLFRIYGSFLANVYYSLQNAMASSIMSISSNCLVLIYMLILEKSGGTKDIVSLAVAHAIAYNIPSIIAFIDLFVHKFKDIRIRLKYIKKTYIKQLTGVGLGFFYLQLIITIAFGSKELLISWFVGADSVVEYNIYQKIIGMAGTLFGLALTPIWAEVSERYVRNEKKKIKLLYVKGIQFLALIGVGQMILVLAFPIINSIWLGSNAVTVSWSSMFVFSIYNIAYMLVMLNYNFLCGMGKVKILIEFLSLIVILGIIFSYVFTKLWPYWAVINIAIICATVPSIIAMTKIVFKNINEGCN